MKTSLFIALFVLLAGMFKAFAQLSIAEACIVHRSVKGIPRGVKAQVRAVYKTRLSLAEPGEKYQATDVISEKQLKDHRLAFWGICENQFFLIYDHGGYGIHRHAILLSIQNGRYTILKNIFVRKTDDFDEVRKKLTSDGADKCDHF